MSVIAIIPARGGSKGIPRKNVLPFLNKPLISHSIAHALSTPSIDATYVSTDDDEIASISERAGARVVRRPAAISDDSASSESALAHLLDEIDFEPELVVFLQATSPLRPPRLLSRGIQLVREECADSLLSVSPFHGFVWRAQGGRVRALSYDFENRPRRQDMGQDYEENGSFYMFRPEILRRHGNRLGGKIRLFPMHPFDSFQIDEPADWALLELAAASRPQSYLPVRPKVFVVGASVEAPQSLGETSVSLKSEDKAAELTSVLDRLGLLASDVAYLGTTPSDLPCFDMVGASIALPGSDNSVLEAARYVARSENIADALNEIASAWRSEE
ncbi:MAG: acylneuraminate cytidylyltransferase [Myxococcota bacterium]